MTISHEFDYHKPTTATEAVDTLRRYGDKARVLAGGTDLVCWLRENMVTPEALVDIKGVPGLDRIVLDGDLLSIGSLVTFTDLIESDVVRSKAPVLAEMAKQVASVGLRNRATLVGNICAAVPCCDSGPVLLALDAEIVVLGTGGERVVPMAQWFKAPRKTALTDGEFVTGLRIRLPKGRWGAVFAKLGRYKGEDLAQASVTVTATERNEYRVAFGSVAPTPVRAARVEALLAGKTIDDALIAQAVALVVQETRPITDIRASKEYRLHMCEVMLARALRAAVDRVNGKGPAFAESVI